ncbi:MAG: hypothetical protein R6W84_12540, partial [Promethearchaeia archaeon]
MSIDWLKAEENPSKSQKIEGKYLLDLRAKTIDLEKQVNQLRNELDKKNEELKDTKAKLVSSEKYLEELTLKLKDTNEKIKSLESTREDLNNKITNL